jgi:hypothetical protein
MARDLRPVNAAPCEAAAKERFVGFSTKWGRQYPAVNRLRENAWSGFVPFLDYEVTRTLPHPQLRHLPVAIPERSKPDAPDGIFLGPALCVRSRSTELLSACTLAPREAAPREELRR